MMGRASQNSKLVAREDINMRPCDKLRETYDCYMTRTI